MDFNEFNHISHAVVGSIAFTGGIVALSTKKGSKTHKIGGKVFVFGMLYAAISTIGFMMEEFRPLAILMSVSTIYFMASSITALRHKKKYSRVVDTILTLVPLLLFVSTSLQFIRNLPEMSLGTLARLLFATTFALVLFRDIKRIRRRPTEDLFFLKRHAFRMILAFGFAIMAVLRIGVKLDFLGLAFTTFLPMLLALLAAFYVERNLVKLLPAGR